MTLEEIKSKICELRCSVEELQEESHNVWVNAESPSTEENVASFLEDALGYIAYRLSELEEMQIDSEGNVDLDGLENGLNEWWEDLGNYEKASIVGIPAPSNDSAAQYDFSEYCNKWWSARTINAKQKVYEDFVGEMPWWEKE